MSDALHGDELVAELERRFLIINDDIRVGGHDLNLIRPRSAEDLINEADFERDERLPYWAELWPSSTILANFVAAAQWAPTRIIELGCGIGLVSIAAAMVGHDVVATDYYDDALHFVRANAYRAIGRELTTRVVDWRALPDDLGTFDIVLASDVLYERTYAEIVADTILRVLAPHGRAYLADPGRVATGAFVDACTERGLTVKTGAERPYLAGKIRQTITVHKIARQSA